MAKSKRKTQLIFVVGASLKECADCADVLLASGAVDGSFHVNAFVQSAVDEVFRSYPAEITEAKVRQVVIKMSAGTLSVHGSAGTLVNKADAMRYFVNFFVKRLGASGMHELFVDYAEGLDPGDYAVIGASPGSSKLYSDFLGSVHECGADAEASAVAKKLGRQSEPEKAEKVTEKETDAKAAADKAARDAKAAADKTARDAKAVKAKADKEAKKLKPETKVPAENKKVTE